MKHVEEKAINGWLADFFQLKSNKTK